MRRLAPLLSLLGLLACGEPDVPTAPAVPKPGAPQVPVRSADAEVAALVDGEPISRVELDAPLRLRLYELELRAHRLRRERLHALIASRLAPGASDGPAEARVSEAQSSGRVEVRLTAPERPRLAIPAGDAPSRGASDAAVTLVVFCDFASSHCARYQPTLRRLVERLPDRLRIAHRDHPLPFHRDAMGAAVAARCAGEQGAYFRYHDALYTRERLDAETRRDLAGTLGLDVERFRACAEGADGAAAREAVESDSAIAARLGLPRVPTTFVNGLYVPGAASFEMLMEVIREELSVAGVALEDATAHAGSAQDDVAVTDLPLRLVATAAHEDPTRASAVIESPRFEGSRVFAPGERVLDDAHLDRVEARRVWLRRGDGRLERLDLSGSGNGEAPPPPEPRLDAAGVLHVPRALIDRALEDREALEAVLEPGQLDLEGKHLLKIQQVEAGSLYDLLGLEDRDVLMQVDGVFVHDQYNPLFEALRTRQRVKVTVMRGGLPQTFEVAIE